MAQTYPRKIVVHLQKVGRYHSVQWFCFRRQNDSGQISQGWDSISNHDELTIWEFLYWYPLEDKCQSQGSHNLRCILDLVQLHWNIFEVSLKCIEHVTKVIEKDISTHK